MKAKLQLAHLPFVKTFEQFDFQFQPSLDERQIRELRSLRFIHEASNVIFLGPPGVGKTHLSVALAEAAIRSGLGAYFITAHDLATDLGRAYREGRLDRRMRVYLAPKVLVIDEVGYLPLDDLGTTIFFQLVSARYERGSIILTSNKSYGDWGSIFGDSIIATAILDRLLHHSTTINIRGESYRLKDRRRAGLVPPRGQDYSWRIHQATLVHIAGECRGIGLIRKATRESRLQFAMRTFSQKQSEFPGDRPTTHTRSCRSRVQVQGVFREAGR